MSTNGKVGFGTILNYWDPATPAGWVEIVEVTNISWDGPSRDTVETYILNASDDYVSKIQGVLNAGSLSATILYTIGQFGPLKTMLETRGNREFQIVLPDGEGIEFAGYLSELPLDISSDDVMQGEVVIQIDGAADFVSSASSAPS